MGAGDSVTTEGWVFLVIILVIFACRIISRRILLGSFKKLQADDYLMTLTIGNFIIVVVSIYTNIIWGNNYVTAEQTATWTKQQFDNAVLGSKWALAMEVCKVSCVWGCKGCLLILYHNLTNGIPKYHRWVKWVAAYVVTGYIVVIICFLGAWCRPFSKYWDMIPLDEAHIQCSSYRNHMILDAVFNISSDLLMLCLPIPMLIKSQLPRKKKYILIGMFSLGGVVILCAALNRITNFTAPYGSLVYLNWYIGETSTAVIVANIPHLWPLMSRIFNLGAFKPSTNSSYNKSPNQYALASKNARNGTAGGKRRSQFDKEGYMRSESQEMIAGETKWSGKTPEGDVELGQFSVTVTGGEVDEREEGQGWRAGTTSPEGHIVKTVHVKHQYSQ